MAEDTIDTQYFFKHIVLQIKSKLEAKYQQNVWKGHLKT